MVVTFKRPAKPATYIFSGFAGLNQQ